MDYLYIKIAILATFFYEEETLFHVVNHLKNHGIHLERDKIKSYLSQLLNEGLIEIFDDPSLGKMKFENSTDEYVEDYWFMLTDKGLKELNIYKTAADS